VIDSVFVPYHFATFPDRSRRGLPRKRNQRNSPLKRRKRPPLVDGRITGLADSKGYMSLRSEERYPNIDVSKSFTSNFRWSNLAEGAFLGTYIYSPFNVDPAWTFVAR
jgi:hypothetical protein